MTVREPFSDTPVKCLHVYTEEIIRFWYYETSPVFNFGVCISCKPGRFPGVHGNLSRWYFVNLDRGGQIGGRSAGIGVVDLYRCRAFTGVYRRFYGR